ncbi:MAG: 16S rRNA (uracil(1498)-N(3))-methyltransferase [Oscillospiraceae bacterium]|nr:16S rRNA (uracil(1498)-N(3))-methyltransferase [Oscillospiraceae bacterium]
MPRFFIPPFGFSPGDTVQISGSDAEHIRRSLRMTAGDILTLCDGAGTDYRCRIIDLNHDGVTVIIDSISPSFTEPQLRITLYQGLPKAEKMEWIVQKAVELGVSAIVPVQTARSIVQINDKAGKKAERWQRIAAEAASQSERGIIPAVSTPISWREALIQVKPPGAVCYEAGGTPLAQLLPKNLAAFSLFIGPEGGFAPEEITALAEREIPAATLGPRILRCETAPMAALTILFSAAGDMD